MCGRCTQNLPKSQKSINTKNIPAEFGDDQAILRLNIFGIRRVGGEPKIWLGPKNQ